MTVARQFFIFVCAATMTGLGCEADVQLPAPIKVTYKWNDPFELNVSWSWNKPDNLPANCTIKYSVWQWGKEILCTEQSYSKETYFTKDMNSDNWNISVQAVRGDKKTCSDWKESKLVNITIKTIKPHTELVRDFKCSVEADRMRCSWVPVSESLKLNVSYRTPKEKDEIRACIRSSSREENVCYLNINVFDYIYVFVETETGMSTFKPQFETPLPDMNIRESGNELILTMPHLGPAVGACELSYNICITECNKVKPCQIHSSNPQQIPYNKNCKYQIEYSVRTTSSCIQVSSDSKVTFYGENRTDATLTVVAIVVPIILAACVILSCYCFRRHREIICPTMPDPSTIFKEMMMSGNKESKPTPENLYTPVPEPIEHVTFVTENTVLQQNA